MSWNITSIGPRAAVKAVVLAQQMPDNLKSLIITCLDEPPYPGQLPAMVADSARVSTYGHIGGGSASIGKLEVELFHAAKLPVTS